MKFWNKTKKDNSKANADNAAVSDRPTGNGQQDQSYGEFENLKNRKYSRSARNKSNQKITPINKAIAFLLVVIIIIPILVLTYFQNQQKLPEPQSADQVMVSKAENESVKQSRIAEEKASESQSIAKSESISLAAESSSIAAESSRAASISEQSAIEAAALSSSLAAAAAATAAEAEAESSVAASFVSEEVVSEGVTEESSVLPEETSESTASSASSSSTEMGTYTVKAGDNLYRIAVNHGMTLEQLLELNGLSPNAEIDPGTVLRVTQ